MSSYTIQQLAEMKGTSEPVRAALIAMQAEIQRLSDALAEARDKALDEAATELERLDGFGEWHEAAQAIRALKSTKPQED